MGLPVSVPGVLELVHIDVLAKARSELGALRLVELCRDLGLGTLAPLEPVRGGLAADHEKPETAIIKIALVFDRSRLHACGRFRHAGLIGDLFPRLPPAFFS